MRHRSVLLIVAGVCVASIAFAAERTNSARLSNGGVAAVSLLVCVLLLVARARRPIVTVASEVIEIPRPTTDERARALATKISDLQGPVASAQRAVRAIDPARPLPSEGRVRDLVASIGRDLERTAALAGDAINTAHAGDTLVLRKTACNLETIAIECIRWFETMAPSHRFFLECSGPRWIVADAFRIDQALRNLLTNAIEHSAPRSRITVAVEHMDLGVQISVTDEGAGFQPEVRARVLSPTFRGARDQLGLFVVRRIAEAHGGRLQIASTPGAGAITSFLLPLRGFNPVV